MTGTQQWIRPRPPFWGKTERRIVKLGVIAAIIEVALMVAFIRPEETPRTPFRASPPQTAVVPTPPPTPSVTQKVKTSKAPPPVTRDRIVFVPVEPTSSRSVVPTTTTSIPPDSSENPGENDGEQCGGSEGLRLSDETSSLPSNAPCGDAEGESGENSERGENPGRSKSNGSQRGAQ